MLFILPSHVAVASCVFLSKSNFSFSRRPARRFQGISHLIRCPVASPYLESIICSDSRSCRDYHAKSSLSQGRPRSKARHEASLSTQVDALVVASFLPLFLRVFSFLLHLSRVALVHTRERFHGVLTRLFSRSRITHGRCNCRIPRRTRRSAQDAAGSKRGEEGIRWSGFIFIIPSELGGR